MMTRTIEVEVDASGLVHPVEPFAELPQGRAVLTWETTAQHENTLLSEASLAEDWLRPEEDAAWLHLQPGK